MTLRTFKVDLHIHTCLSPCASLEMSPLQIVEKAKEKGLDVIAICDHNSAENTEAVINAGRKKDLAVFPGLEISTREEIHVMGVFGNVDAAMKVQQVVYSNLEGLNREDYFGMQVIANEYDDVIDFNPLFLAGSTKLSFEKTVELIRSGKGMAIAAHIDRQAFGLLGHFGFLPEDINLHALEVSSRGKVAAISREMTPRNEKPLLFNSDAHFLKDIGRQCNRIMAEASQFECIYKAITGEEI
jgi:PHP family Zn ribbon phosphoesterase